MPDTAMILAAGLGMRMRPITETIPKPLVPVGGKPMIDHVLENLEREGIENIVVNIHHLGDQIVGHMASRPGLRARISDESDQLLESGGGVLKALPLLGDKPFYILNSDTFWLEEPDRAVSNLASLAAAWDPAQMDMLLMTAPFDRVVGYDGRGDFLMDDNGRLTRHDGASANPVIYPGVAIVNPGIFAGMPAEPFSLNICFDRAIERGRLFGLHGPGLWLTIGTPGAIGEAEQAMKDFLAEKQPDMSP